MSAHPDILRGAEKEVVRNTDKNVARSDALFAMEGTYDANTSIYMATTEKEEENPLSISLSSERFSTVFTDEEENEDTDSIDQISQLFAGFTKKPPTLEEALRSMGYEKAKELTELFTKNATEKLKELDAPDLTVEDIAVVFCYTFEWNTDKLGEGESPYKKLNNSLSVDRSNAALKKTRGFLFLLLQALRKLPHFFPENGVLYRGLRMLVQTEPDPDFPERKPYAAGKEKTWWAFTSTTTDLETTQEFIQATGGTLFVVSGEPWGYDISVFSDFPEEKDKEILLEPERKLRVTSITKEGQLITVNVEMLSTPVVLKEIVKIPSTVREVKVRGSTIKEAPRDLRVEHVTANTVELSWAPMTLKDKAVNYQVVMKSEGKTMFDRSTSDVYSGADTKCTANSLEPLKEYEFQVRCGCDNIWGKWSEKIVVKTKIPVPSDFTTKAESWDTISASWKPVTINIGSEVAYALEMNKTTKDEMFTKVHEGLETKFTKRELASDTEYALRLRTVCGNEVSEWSEASLAKTQKAPNFSECVWKECPRTVGKERIYSMQETNLRVITKTNGDSYCTATGNAPLPPGQAISWGIRLMDSLNNGHGVYVGVASSGIDQNEDEAFKKCGWYLYCFNLKLWSGPPHNYEGKEYGPRKESGCYVFKGDSVGVVMDAAKGELSFVLNGVNLGVAFDGIPLDKPLVPCVVLFWEKDSVELDTTEVKEKVNSSIPAPSNIATKNTTWHSITLSWDAVEGASFYQIEVDGSKFWDASSTNTFVRKRLASDTEHSFKVRAVCGNEVSEWSDAVEGRTQIISEFSKTIWEECPDYVDEKKKYSVDETNPRIATKTNNSSNWCTIIGNTPLPHNKVTSWSIKILKSRNNNGNDIFIGVAPSDIDQNEGDNYNKCGWYFSCYYSALWSGPPHSYYCKEYRPRKEKEQYVRTGDSVGVVMDTAKGELSFILNCVNLGVAYDAIPLGKPLVPCVLLKIKNDSVELDTYEVKESVNSSIPVPSNITTKSVTTWDSITLSWNAVEGASFYQIEINKSIQQLISENTLTKTGLQPDTEHSFRVRAVYGNEVSEWSVAVKEKTMCRLPGDCVWKQCSGRTDKERKYSFAEKNPRIVTNVLGCYCTVVGNACLPENKVVLWCAKVLKSKDNDGDCINVGVAPFKIDQDSDINQISCGWYLNCYDFTLWSGPPHNYTRKWYSTRKEEGKYIQPEDSVGVVMDTAKGELSFVVDGVNLGVAYEGIPLDKPLVPCVIFGWEGDSVELII